MNTLALRPKSLLVCLLGLGAVASPVLGAEYRVSSAAEIARVTGRLHPGDTLIMADGVWKDQAIAFHGQGQAGKPITLRAETPGKVILTGATTLKADGQYLVVEGVCLKNALPTADGIAVNGQHCRLTDCAVIDSREKFCVHIAGTENRMDHCYLAGKTSAEPTLQIEVGDTPNHDHIDHNLFGPRPPLGRNGGETMRVGFSWQSMRSSAALVEQNLFDRCDGEIEIISSKSCDNIYRDNTFLDCAGMLTLRHGNRCRVEGNFFLAHHKKGSGGIRVIGEDHVIVNNYIDGVDQGAFWITSGILNSPLVGYFRARNAVIAFNTVVDSRGSYLAVNWGIGKSNRTLPPENITIADNLFSVPQGGTLIDGTEGAGYQWLGNLATGPGVVDHPGINVVNARLEQAKDGLWRPASDSPARGAAVGDFPTVKTDIDGQARTQPLDVGCDQISDAPVTNRPLTAADVGPSWMSLSAKRNP